MSCGKYDKLISAYLDGQIEREEHTALDSHTAGCRRCREQMAEAEFALRFLNSAPAVEPPPDMVANILHDTIGIEGMAPVVAGGSAAPGGFAGWLGRLFRPPLQPRFVMSMAMAVLSFSMLGVIGQRSLSPAGGPGAGPAAAVEVISEWTDRTWQRATQLYETVRLFYQIQSEFDENQPREAEVTDRLDRTMQQGVQLYDALRESYNKPPETEVVPQASLQDDPQAAPAEPAATDPEQGK
jgi:anti-sigma factor RsiW